MLDTPKAATPAAAPATAAPATLPNLPSLSFTPPSAFSRLLASPKILIVTGLATFHPLLLLRIRSRSA